jgi:hypothetical protein
MKSLALALLFVASCASAQTTYRDGQERLISPGTPQFRMPSAATPPTTAAPYTGPHRYSVKRNGQYGYADEAGEVHFFGAAQQIGDKYQVVDFDPALGSALIRCEGDCSIVDVYSAAGQQTFQPLRGSLLWSVVQDMKAGALR